MLLHRSSCIGQGLAFCSKCRSLSHQPIKKAHSAPSNVLLYQKSKLRETTVYYVAADFISVRARLSLSFGCNLERGVIRLCKLRLFGPCHAVLCDTHGCRRNRKITDRPDSTTRRRPMPLQARLKCGNLGTGEEKPPSSFFEVRTRARARLKVTMTMNSAWHTAMLCRCEAPGKRRSKRRPLSPSHSRLAPMRKAR